ncbi:MULTISPECIES: DNA methyltransferase [unclassified Leucobacter]|uniref:DNA methyltransferase n=1 Tax=unclassified Leucobacter TaxID=2621730 RepID=UPI0012DFF8ED|nr:DNA methyltransferase [Leucobacter sp. Ag1]
MTPAFEHGPVTVYRGDCREVMAGLPDNSVDAIVTDPPYELGFMGKGWDSSGIAYDPEVWAQAFRVLKPGGHALVFGGTRTWHRVAVAIEDAGFEIRDNIAWLYGQGFPKSLDVAKAIDKMRVEDVEPTRVICRAIRVAMDADGLRSRDLVQYFDGCHPRLIDHWAARDTDSQPSLPTTEQWATLQRVIPSLGAGLDAEVQRLNTRKGTAGDAWAEREVTGTVEAWENRTNFAMTTRDGIARDAAREGTAAAEWEGWGTAFKPAHEPVIVARKPLERGLSVAQNVLKWGTGALNIDAGRIGSESTIRARTGQDFGILNDDGWTPTAGKNGSESGRFPANVILDESQAAELDRQTGTLTSGKLAAHHARAPKDAGILGSYGSAEGERGFGDSGGGSRFFYVAKAGRDERPVVDGHQHTTVKPLALIRYLLPIVSRPGGRVLDMFAGSGTTGEACVIEGFECVLIELDEDGTHIPLIEKRLGKPHQQTLFGAFE